MRRMTGGAVVVDSSRGILCAAVLHVADFDSSAALRTEPIPEGDPMTESGPISHLAVDDAEGAIAFYQAAFGATLEARHPADDGKRLMFVSLKIGAGSLYLHDDFPEFGEHGAKPPRRLGGTSCTIHIETADADAAWQRALAAGATVLMPLDNQFWGARYGKLADPFGHHWSIGGPVKAG
jgi:PhnB protein